MPASGTTPATVVSIVGASPAHPGDLEQPVLLAGGADHQAHVFRQPGRDRAERIRGQDQAVADEREDTGRDAELALSVRDPED